jgi:hypothetical protein
MARELFPLSSIGGPSPIPVLYFRFILILQHSSLGIGNSYFMFRMVYLHSVFPPAFASFGLDYWCFSQIEVFWVIVSVGRDGILE